MVKIKTSKMKKEATEKKSIIVNLQKARVLKWENFDSSKKFRIGYIQVPVTEWENLEDIDKQLPEGTWIKNIKLKVNPEKGFFNIIECEVEEMGGGESGSKLEEQTDSPPLTTILAKCPACGERIVWFNFEIERAFKRLVRSIKDVVKLFHLKV